MAWAIFCANAVAGYETSLSNALASMPRLPPEIAVLTTESGVAEARASGIAEAKVRGVTKLDIGVVKEKKTKIRPARAGFAQLAPRPPKVHLATAMAKALAITGMKSGTEDSCSEPPGDR